MEEKDEVKVRLSTVVLLVIVFVLVVAWGIVYYIGFVKKEEQVQNDRETTVTGQTNFTVNNIKNENVPLEDTTYQVLDIDSELVANAYSFIPTVEYNDMMPTAYQKSKITFNDLPNEIKLINVFNHIDFSKEKVKLNSSEEEKAFYSAENWAKFWFEYDAEIMNRNAKKIYGPNATIIDESFELYYGCSSFYENGTYHHSFGGAGTSLIPVTYITKAYIDDEKLYIHDKFLVAKGVENESREVYGEDMHIYDTTISTEPIEIISADEIESITSLPIKEYFIDKYKKQMTSYKHTFEKNENGDYYWVSTEPVK